MKQNYFFVSLFFFVLYYLHYMLLCFDNKAGRLLNLTTMD